MTFVGFFVGGGCSAEEIRAGKGRGGKAAAAMEGLKRVSNRV